MNKSFYLMATIVAAVGLSACSSTTDKNSTESSTPITKSENSDKTEVFSGVMPAADASGISYTIEFNYNGDSNHTNGDFEMTQTYLVGDAGTSKSPRDTETFHSDGNFTVETPSSGAKYLKLVPGNSKSDADNYYFVITSDSTITMVDSSLKPSENSQLNYTLYRAR